MYSYISDTIALLLGSTVTHPVNMLCRPDNIPPPWGNIPHPDSITPRKDSTNLHPDSTTPTQPQCTTCPVPQITPEIITLNVR